MKIYDAIVIGSGQGGTPLAKKLAKAGWKTALVEKSYVGGTCVNVGCTPSKTMIASAKAIHTIRRAKEWGLIAELKEIDIKAIIKRKSDVVDLFRDSAQDGLEATDNLELIWGQASFRERNVIETKLNSGGISLMKASKIFISTGTKQDIPDIAGIAESGYLTSTTLMDLKEIPAHLLIIGGGYIALEFGQMYRRFGSDVTILNLGDRLLDQEDTDISDEVKKLLELEGIRIICRAETRAVVRDGDELKVSFEVGPELRSVSCSHLLVAAGRLPNSMDLNLPSAGVKTDDQGYIIVNEYLETSAEGIYAIGDVKGGPEFTHVAYNDHLILLRNLLRGEKQSTERLVPYCMFIDPQLGRIGMTEAEARAKGFNIKVACMPMSRVARAIETGDERGLMKAVVDAGTGQILGAAILGEEGGEVMSVLQMAMLGKIDYSTIRNMMFAHPLYAESLNNLFMEFDDDRSDAS
ncbi:mercuric reductase [Arcticibacter sp.]|uniref:mercuric reductase n=1 Tax=Arcticibacter sp. TaxID=1872630 RepID=UPI00388FB4DF